MQQQTPADGTIVYRADGAQGVVRGGRVYPVQGASGGRAIAPLITPAEQRAQEDQRLQRAAAERSADTADRLARVEEHQVQQAAASADRQATQDESGLRQEFARVPTVRAYADIRDAYQRIGVTGTSGTAGGDLSLIFAYMKMLDPGSTVREGEFATAQQATGVPGQVVNLYNQLRSGQRLNPDQRQDFITRAADIYRTAHANYTAEAEYYRGLAEQQGFSPDNVARLLDAVEISGLATPGDRGDGQSAGDDGPDPRLGYGTLRGFGGANEDGPGGRGNPFDFDALDNNQRQTLQSGDWIAGRNPDGTYWRTRVLETGYPADGQIPEGAEPVSGGYIVPTPETAQGRAAALANSAAEQVPGGDELAHGIVGYLTGDGYSAVRDFDRRQDEVDRLMYPDTRNAAGVATGALGLALPGRNALALAGWGGAYGAGAADGGAQERALGAGVGAATGYVGGRVIERAAPAIGRAASGAGNALADFSRSVVNGGRNALGRTSPQEQAVNALAVRALPADDMAARAAEARRFGAEPTLVDVGGDALQGQVRVAATRSTEGRQAAVDFAAGRRSDIQDYVARQGEIVSPVNRSPQEIDDVLQRYQSEASRPEFDAVRGETFQPSPELSNLIPQPYVQRAIVEAANRERDPAVRAALEAYRGGQPLTIGMADRIARVLGGQRDAAIRAGDRDLAGTFGQLSEALRREARQAVPAYGSALDNFAERARIGDAADIGQGFMGNRGNTRDFVNDVGRIPEGDPMAAARAAARSGIEQASGTPRNALAALDTMANSRGFQHRANALLGPEGAAEIRRAGQVGRNLVEAARNSSPRGNSQTFANMDDAASQDAVSGLTEALRRPFTAGVPRVIDYVRSRGFSQEGAEEIVRMAFDPARTDEAIRLLGQRMAPQEASQVVEGLRRQIGAAFGSAQRLIGSQGSPAAVGYLEQPTAQ